MTALLGVDRATLGATLGMIKATLLLPPHLGHQESGKTLQQQKVLGVSLRGNLRIVQETWDLKRPAEWLVHAVDNYKRLRKMCTEVLPFIKAEKSVLVVLEMHAGHWLEVL